MIQRLHAGLGIPADLLVGNCQDAKKMSTKQDIKKSTFQDNKCPRASFLDLLT